MDVIQSELDTIRKVCHDLINGTRIVTCMTSLIRIELKQTHFRQLIVCIRFPENYPNHNLLVELKSKTLSGKLLDGLTNLCEQKAKEFLGKPQVLEILKFLSLYLNENPLCIVFDEIANLKKLINVDDGSELKLRQKTSCVQLLAKGGNYYFKAKILVPEDYPISAVSWKNHESNLPIVLVRFLNGQAREIARQCVEPPLRPDKLSQQKPFEPRPSLERALTLLIAATSDFYTELCPICKKRCLPADPDGVITNDTRDDYVERVFCGHIYHQGCLRQYLQEPPFPAGGKLCPAPKRHPRSDRNPTKNRLPKNDLMAAAVAATVACSIRLSHDRWGLSATVAEARWAQKQARQRELDEVKDFLQ